MTPEGTIKALIDTVLKDRDDTVLRRCRRLWQTHARLHRHLRLHTEAKRRQGTNDIQRITISNMLLAGAWFSRFRAKRRDAFVKWLGKVINDLQTTK